MTRNLYRVFTRIRVGSTEECDEYLIEHCTISANEMTEDCGTCLVLGEWCALDGAEVQAGDSYSFGAANTDDADGSTLSGGNGTDGIVGMHSLSINLQVHAKIQQTSEIRKACFNIL